MRATIPKIKVQNHPKERYLFKVIIDYGTHIEDFSGWVDRSQISSLTSDAKKQATDENIYPDTTYSVESNHKLNPWWDNLYCFRLINDFTDETISIGLPKLKTVSAFRVVTYIFTSIEDSLVEAGFIQRQVKAEESLAKNLVLFNVVNQKQPMRGWSINKRYIQNQLSIDICNKSLSISNSHNVKQYCIDISVSNLAWHYILDRLLNSPAQIPKMRLASP